MDNETTTDLIRIPGITPLPVFNRDQAEPETLAHFGLRVLQFVIAHECTATISTEDLETADHFYPIAVSHLDPERYSAGMIDRIADARRTIQAALRWRAAEDQAKAQAAAQANQDDPTPPRGRDRQDNDPRVPNHPPTPQLPPGGAQEDPYAAARARIEYLKELATRNAADPYAISAPRRQPTF